MSSVELSAAIAEALARAGADTVFGMPGGGNNLDFIGAAEAAGLRFVLAHAETPAAIMAAVYADLTDAPAVCLVTRGPGAASAVNGVANAMLDRQQLVVITDCVSAADQVRIAHQRLDQPALLSPVTKWSATAGTGEPGATVEHALLTAMTPPRGPVHLDFDPSAPSTPVPSPRQAPPIDPGSLEEVARLVSTASRPVVLLGGGARPLTGPVRALLEHTSVPTLTTYRGKGIIPDSWPNAGGMLTGATTEAPLLEAADLIVMIGVDTVELIPSRWRYPAPVISIASWPDDASYLAVEVALVGDLDKLVAHLAEHWPRSTWERGAGNLYRDAELTRLLEAGSAPGAAPVGGVSPQDVVRRTRAIAPAGTIATVDAGAHMLPAMALWEVEHVDETLVSSGLATMGFAVPAAVGAALARPGRRVVCFTGDGGLGMCLGELETIHRLDLPITLVVFNDARLSLIAIKAKPEDNGGENAIGYERTDFAAVARGYGLHGARAADVGELDAALLAAMDHTGPSLIDVYVDPRAYPEILAVIRGDRPRAAGTARSGE